MTDALNWLRLRLSGIGLVFLTVTGRAIAGQAEQYWPSVRQTGVGLFTNFFDTLGRVLVPLRRQRRYSG